MRHKQKPDLKITGVLPAIFSVIVFLMAFIIWGPPTAFYILGSIILFYATMIMYAYFRTKHIYTFVGFVYMLVFGLFLVLSAPHMIIGREVHFPVISKLLIVVIIPLFWYMIYLNFTRKLKWRGREILELAAYNVEQTNGTFTERPMPTGKVMYKKNDLLDFAAYFEKHLLGLTYVEQNRVVFMPLKYKNEYFALYNPNYNYLEKTWVAISFNGDLSVNISKDDYLDYREDLAFDQLCTSLSDVIVEFLELYLDGREVRIMDEMDKLRVNVFT